MKAAHGSSCRLVGGNTGVGVEKYYNENLAFDAASVYVDISRLKELAAVQPSASGKTLLVGSAVPINDLVEILQTAHKAAPASTATFLRSPATACSSPTIRSATSARGPATS